MNQSEALRITRLVLPRVSVLGVVGKKMKWKYLMTNKPLKSDKLVDAAAAHQWLSTLFACSNTNRPLTLPNEFREEADKITIAINALRCRAARYEREVINEYEQQAD